MFSLFNESGLLKDTSTRFLNDYSFRYSFNLLVLLIQVLPDQSLIWIFFLQKILEKSYENLVKINMIFSLKTVYIRLTSCRRKLIPSP